jgi:hypothetical protein
MSDLVPELRQIRVAPEKLYPDPNNPRFISREEDESNHEDAIDLLDKTLTRMRSPKVDYKIDELKNSIVQNGWWPVDCIFVRKLDEQGHFLVLEGNRRVTALRDLLNDPDIEQELRNKISTIEVMEIIDDISAEELKKKITYLLGVRHHGSLKKWTPFAQAHNILKRYLELKDISNEEFRWDPSVGSLVADALSISAAEVEYRLKVYKCMEQLALEPDLNEAEGRNAGIKDRYYSVCSEILLTNKASLKNYISQDPETFFLSRDSLDRLKNLCHFDLIARKGAPIKNPQEWRSLAKILEEEEPARRQDMLDQVEGGEKLQPSIVYAERSAELQKLRWDTWLTSALAIMKNVNFGDDISSEEARKAAHRLLELINALDALDEK